MHESYRKVHPKERNINEINGYDEGCDHQNGKHSKNIEYEDINKSILTFNVVKMDITKSYDITERCGPFLLRYRSNISNTN
jgi:hypothetical protein